jgi:hypothetical protein
MLDKMQRLAAIIGSVSCGSNSVEKLVMGFISEFRVVFGPPALFRVHIIVECAQDTVLKIKEKAIVGGIMEVMAVWYAGGCQMLYRFRIGMSLRETGIHQTHWFNGRHGYHVTDRHAVRCTS